MASKEEFGSQYEFDQSIVQLLSTANDGHLAVLPCTSKIFDFMVELPVVSISSDGIELPKIYTAADAKLMSSGSSNVSPIVAINGKAAAAAIEKLSIPQMLQDPDAR